MRHSFLKTKILLRPPYNKPLTLDEREYFKNLNEVHMYYNPFGGKKLWIT